MKKQSILLLIILTTGSSLFAQKVSWGPETKQSKREYLNSIAYCDQECMYIMQNEYKGGKITPSLHKMGKNFNPVFEKEYASDEKNLMLEDFIYGQDKFHLFTTKYDKDADKTTLYASTIDMNGSMKTKAKSLVSMPSPKKSKQSSFYLEVSDDTSKFLIYSQTAYEKDEKEKYYIRVTDNNLNTLWESSVTLPYGDKFLEIENYIVGNNGDVYILGKLYESVYKGIFGGTSGKESKKEDGKKVPNYQYIVIRYSATELKGKEYKLSLGDKFISDISFKVSPDGNLICAGVYCNKLYGPLQGIFYMRVDGNNGAVAHKNMKEIDGSWVEAMRKGLSQKEKGGGGDKGLSSRFDIKNFVIKEDGGAAIVLEYFYYYVVTTTSTSSSGATVTRTTPHWVYGDKLVVSVNPAGEILWVADIPTYSDMTSDIYGSSSLMVEGSNIHILYNDDEDNVDKPITARPDIMRNAKKSVAVLATVNSSGKVTRKRLFENKDIETILRPDICKQVSANEMVLYGTKYKMIGPKEIRFGRLSWSK